MSFITGLFGGSKSGASKTQFSAMNSALWQGQNLANLGGATTGEAKGQLTKAEGTLNKSLSDLGAPLDMWKKILTGDKTAVTASMAPEINTILGQYDTAFKTQNELNPRGGGTTAFNQNLQYKKIGDILNTLLGARKEAAGQVASLAGQEASVGGEEASIGSVLGQIGAGETSASIQDLSLAAGTATDRIKQQTEQQKALGEGLGSMVGQLLFGA